MNGPRQPTYEAAAQVRALLNKIDEGKIPPPYIMATIDGGIDLEWTRDERELHVAVFEWWVY